MHCSHPKKLKVLAVITTALAQWQTPVAGAGAGSTVTALLAYLLASTAQQNPEAPVSPLFCPGSPQSGFSDDWHRLSAALASLPLDYLLCALLGICASLAVDIFHIVRQALSAYRRDSVQGSRQSRRPEFLALDVTRGH